MHGSSRTARMRTPSAANRSEVKVCSSMSVDSSTIFRLLPTPVTGNPSAATTETTIAEFKKREKKIWRKVAKAA